MSSTRWRSISFCRSAALASEFLGGPLQRRRELVAFGHHRGQAFGELVALDLERIGRLALHGKVGIEPVALAALLAKLQGELFEVLL